LGGLPDRAIQPGFFLLPEEVPMRYATLKVRTGIRAGSGPFANPDG